VRRDFVAIYKQTVLGPLWYIIQPLMTVAMFTIVFSRIAKVPTAGIPPVLFYTSGVVCWNFFAACLKNTASTFVSNADIFGKVYFPRLVLPLSTTISSMISFLIQFGLLLLIWAYYYFFQGYVIDFTLKLLLLPVLIVMLAVLGLSCGIIISSFTTKYKDLIFLLGFGIQLFMYANPVVYSVSILPEKMYHLSMLNPLAPIIETFRYVIFNSGVWEFEYLVLSAFSCLLLFLIGVVLFNRVEKTFMDSI
jgi:lipopolysaccharide transport system permease protein